MIYDVYVPYFFSMFPPVVSGYCTFRYIILHDKRIGGAGPSCKGHWGLGNVPTGRWSHVAAVYTQNGPSYMFVNGHKSKVINTIHDGHPAYLMLGAPYKTGHLASAHVASARVYNNVLSDAEILAHSRSPPGQFCKPNAGLPGSGH